MKLFKLLLIVLLTVAIPVFIYSEVKSSAVKVTKVYEDVKIQKKGESVWNSVNIDQMLKQNDIIGTGINSYAELEIAPGNSFRLKENSQIVINDLEKESKDVDGSVVKLTHFDLLEGDVVFKLDKLPKDTLVQVSSPTAVAGARGTAFRVRYTPSVKLAKVGVLESSVRVVSVGEPNKYTMVPAFKKVTVTPWAMAVANVRGTGILSEKILGEKFVKEAKSAVAEASGRGKTEIDAKNNAYYNLSKWVLNIAVGPEKRIEDVLNEKPSLCQLLYRYIAKADIKSTKTVNNEVEITLELTVTPIADIIGYPLPPMPVIVKEVNMKEYADKFGALARVTTQRAAQLDGYRKLAEAMYGTVISSSTTLQDMVAADDRITTTVEGVVKGAEIIDTKYFSDGSVSVIMTIRADIIKSALVSVTGDIFGVNYFTTPKIIDIDDFVSAEWM